MMKILNHSMFSNENQFLWKFLLVAIALIIGLSYGSAHLALLQDMGWDYHNTIFITSFEAWDAEHYIAQIREIYEGNYRLSNAYIAESKHTTLSKWPLFPLYLSALIGKFFQIPPYLLPVVMDIVLPPVIFLLAYAFLRTISSRKSLSLFGAFILSTIPHIGRIELFPLIAFRIAKNGFTPSLFREAHCCYGFTRTINPQLTYIFLLASLLFFTKGMKTRNHKHFVFAAIFGICTSYSYVYFSTYLYVFLGIGALLSLLCKKRIWFWRYISVLGGILLCSIPFWWIVFRSSNSELNQMSWMLNDHTPIFNAQIGLILGLCGGIAFCLYACYIKPLPGVVTFSLLASGVICLNQHVVTGLYVQPGHYMLHTIPQATILSTVLLVAEARRKFSFTQISLDAWCVYGGIIVVLTSVCLHPRIVASYFSSDGVLSPELVSLFTMIFFGGITVGIGLSTTGVVFVPRKHSPKALSWIKKVLSSCYLPVKIFAFTVCFSYIIWDISTAQIWAYQERLLPSYGAFQQLSPAVQWLNLHTEKESVVLCDPDSHSTPSVITIYTHNNVYVSEFSQYYTVPSLDELQDRFHNVMAFMGVTTEQEFKSFMPGTKLLGGFEDYQEKSTRDLYTELKKYRVDFYFHGPQEQKITDSDPGEMYPFLEEVYNDGAVKIYQIL